MQHFMSVSLTPIISCLLLEEKVSPQVTDEVIVSLLKMNVYPL